MKTIFTLFLSLLVGVAAIAADIRPKSQLLITSADRGDIRVVIDGRRFEPNKNVLRIRDIQSGSHTIKVYKEKTGGFFTIFGKRYEMVFSRTLRLRNNMSTQILIDRYGRATIQESRSKGNGNNRDFRDFPDNGDWDRNNDFEFERGRNGGDYGMNDRDFRGDRDFRDDRDFRNDQDYGYNSNRSMSDLEFNRVLESMQKEWLESNKQKSAQQIIAMNYLSTDQVKRMLQMFSFESIKLDLAKQAYAKTVDQRNYVLINEVFSFSSSKDDLARYVRTFRN